MPLTKLSGSAHVFYSGIVLAIGFDRLDSLDELWTLHRNNKLQPILHEILVTPAVLKTLSCKHITLDVKLWDDEYDDCRKELLNKVSRHDNIRDNGKQSFFCVSAVKGLTSWLSFVMFNGEVVTLPFVSWVRWGA